MARLIVWYVGLPRAIEWRGKTVHTAIWKEPFQGGAWSGAQSRWRMDREIYMGPEATSGGLCLSYRFVSVPGRSTGPKRFHLRTVRGDFTVGAWLTKRKGFHWRRYRIGDPIRSKRQPRVTCYRVGIRMNEPQCSSAYLERQPGFYFRVLQEG